MTREREEALEELKEIRFNLNYKVNGTSRFDKALDMAIKLLEQEPCEDCISRQDVLDINEHHHGQMPNHVNHEIWREINALPSVTQQPKVGH